MNKLFIFLAFLFSSISLNAQTCQWAQKIGGTDFDYITSSAVDINGNLYVVGDFSSDTLLFNNGIYLINSGYRDGYFAKYNSSCLCIWAYMPH